MGDEDWNKYRRMLRMGVPRQQVDAAMRMDGKDPARFVEQDEATAGGPPSDGAGMDLTPRGDQYDKYRKMLKCGLPMGAALQAMAKDGVDPKGFNAGPPAEGATPAVVEAKPPQTDTSGGGGFLGELKLRAEAKRGDGPVRTNPASEPRMPLSQPGTPANASSPKPPSISPANYRSGSATSSFGSPANTAATSSHNNVQTVIKPSSPMPAMLTKAPASPVMSAAQNIGKSAPTLTPQSTVSSTPSPTMSQSKVQPKPISMSSPNGKSEYSTIPKGLQRRFAWE